ncbi:UNVERIFIED_CONTAM: AT-hook motif nuclear-localized protein 6 [Sesamum latifolium]|uniref:AT-hook motif nuclear-localized protein n=1 Tax=Sesamum latifolium TaxID=2727402 RepID=A0AAW2XFN9_9LAMI
MEEIEGLNGSGVTVKGDEAPQSFRVEPRVVNPDPSQGGSTVPPTPAVPVSAAAPAAATEGKKKRGGQETWKHSSGRSFDSSKKKHKLDFESPGGTMAFSLGASFIPHVITVNAGEDVNMKIISFSQQGSRAICILAANGTISNVTLRQPNSSGGTLTYEGRFEILSLTGSFMPSDNGLTKSRSGGMSVSLAGPDGHVLGGGLAGMLVAAGPVQFLPVHSLSVKTGPARTGCDRQLPPRAPAGAKAQETKIRAYNSLRPVPTNPVSEERYEAAYSGPKPNLTTSASFHGDNNMASVNSVHHSKTSEPRSNVSLPGEDSREQSHEITC